MDYLLSHELIKTIYQSACEKYSEYFRLGADKADYAGLYRKFEYINSMADYTDNRNRDIICDTQRKMRICLKYARY